MTLFKREPIQVENTVPPHEPDLATQMRLIELQDAVTRALEVLGPALRGESGPLDRRAQDVLLDVRNALVPPLPLRPSVPVIPGRS